MQMIKGCISVIPSGDLQTSLRFWIDGLGFTMDREIRNNGRLIGCMVHNETISFWLNERAGSSIMPQGYEGIRLYWTPIDIYAIRNRLKQLGFNVTEIEHREYGQTEFFVSDNDGYHHCFGVDTKSIEGNKTQI